MLTTHLQHSSDGKIAFDDPLGEHARLSASSATINNNRATARSSLYVSALVYLRGDRHHHVTVRFFWQVLVVAYLIFNIVHLAMSAMNPGYHYTMASNTAAWMLLQLFRVPHRCGTRSHTRWRTGAICQRGSFATAGLPFG